MVWRGQCLLRLGAASSTPTVIAEDNQKTLRTRRRLLVSGNRSGIGYRDHLRPHSLQSRALRLWCHAIRVVAGEVIVALEAGGQRLEEHWFPNDDFRPACDDMRNVDTRTFIR